MTRFDYPILGMKQPSAPDHQNRGGVEKSYQRPNSPYTQNQYDDQRQAYDRSSRGYGQNHYQSRQQIDDRYADNREVYDTKSTLQNRSTIERQQLAELNQNTRQEQRYRPVAERTDYALNNRQPRPKPHAGDRHVVVTGDTLYNISKRYNVTTEKIRRANGISGNDIKLGQHLVIPGFKKAELRSAPRSSLPVGAPLKAGSKYKVQRGDTVYSISRRAGVSPKTLADANGLPDQTRVQLGQELIIPGQIKQPTPVQVASIDRRAKVPAPIRKQRQTTRKLKRPKSGLNQSVAGNQRFLWPVRGRIISKFGRQKGGTINDGVNVAVPTGTNVKAAEAGTVAYAGNELKGYGHLILIRHKNNWVSAYSHNSKLMVKRGDKVRRGQVIAKSGKTGSVRQPQLHFELRRGSKPVNPLKYLAMK